MSFLSTSSPLFLPLSFFFSFSSPPTYLSYLFRLSKYSNPSSLLNTNLANLSYGMILLLIGFSNNSNCLKCISCINGSNYSKDSMFELAMRRLIRIGNTKWIPSRESTAKVILVSSSLTSSGTEGRFLNWNIEEEDDYALVEDEEYYVEFYD